MPKDRKLFYQEAVENWENTHTVNEYVEVVNIFLFNKKGEVILQKRSDSKAHNPGLLDKSIGGHVVHCDTSVYTCMLETIQELQIPCIVTESGIEFSKTYELLVNYLGTVSILKHIETDFFDLTKIIDSKEIIVGNKAHIYFGIYDGAIRFADSEARGISFYTLDELAREIDNTPHIFTQDIIYYLSRYRKELQDFVQYFT